MGYQVRYGGRHGRSFTLVERPDLVVVRTNDRAPLERTGMRRESREAMKSFAPLLSYPEAGVEVWRCDEAHRSHT